MAEHSVDRYFKPPSLCCVLAPHEREGFPPEFLFDPVDVVQDILPLASAPTVLNQTQVGAIALLFVT